MLQAHHGEYVNVIEECALSRLVQSGVPTLLRYAVDDQLTPVHVAAVQCLSSLLVCEAEEALLEDCCDCHAATLIPSLAPSCSKAQGTMEDDEGGESDTELVQQDVVKVWYWL